MTYEELAAAYEALKVEHAAVLVRLEALERRLRKNSTNSSSPPSSDHPKVERPKRPPSGLKRGGQPGHKGHQRATVAPDRVDHRVVCNLDEPCEYCGSSSLQEQGRALRQTFELPEIRPIVTEYDVEHGRCTGCRRRRRAATPIDMPKGCLGPRAQALSATLTGGFHLSRRDTEKLLGEVMGLDVSLGTVSNTEKVVSLAIEPAYDEVKGHIDAAPVKHVDETGVSRAGVHHTAWALSTPQAVLLRLGQTRGRKAFDLLRGPRDDDVFVTDRYVVYDKIPAQRRQLCWSHILRVFQALVDDPVELAKEVGGKLQKSGRAALHAYNEHKRGAIERSTRDATCATSRSEMKQLLALHRDLTGLKTLMYAFWLAERSVWLFLERDDVDPTNNRVERDLRPLVIWQKTSFGTASNRGDRFAERMLTVVGTSRKQGRSFYDFIVDATVAKLVGRLPMRLLPAPSG